MTYNLHQLLHLCQSVLNWGPLWSHSAFPFEAKTGQLVAAIKGGRGVILQILRNINMHHSYTLIEKHVYDKSSDVVKRNLENFLLCKTKNYKIKKLTEFLFMVLEKIFLITKLKRNSICL